MSFPTIADMVHLDIDRLVENERKKESFNKLIEHDVAQDILGRPLDESLESCLAQFSVSDLDTLFSTTPFPSEAPYLFFESLSNEMHSAAAISIADTESCSPSEWTEPKVSSTNAFILRPVTPGDWACESEEPTSPPLAVDYSSGKSRDFAPKYLPRAPSFDRPTQEENYIPTERFWEEEK
ncbi:hypothetical protein A7U60_g3796 [Sanghuangporus baumii]|uniref:Uncharacterized protein n=1 Tax=Sanghuangporus baumii TaxID=108892 RepID=A0A9Q5HZR0_SANBA|nr:hypothetical protein A7U60_g3796 [Sanghuangporus baumii]